MEPKIVKNMSQEEYLSYPAMSKSKLWLLESGPERFKSDIPVEPTPAMNFGRWAHLLMLEQDRFLAETCQLPKFDRRTKAGKENYALWHREHEGQEIISAADMEKLAGMRAALDNGNNTMAQHLLEYGESEVSIFWELEGINFKCRIDKLNNDKRIAVEYKTVRSVKDSVFASDMINFGYDVQLALYSDGIRAYFDDDFEFLIVAQEKTAPYLIRVFKPDEQFYDIGERRLGNLIEKYKSYEAVDWKLPDGRFISDFIATISPPSWAAYKT